jgi:hypothetical protein
VVDPPTGGRTAEGVVIPGQGPFRQVLAVVRTQLAPQGYVEVDGWLYRARWMVEEQPRPGPGATVLVTERIEDVVGGYRWAYPAPEPEPTGPGERR